MVQVRNVKGSSRFNKEKWIQYWSDQKGYRPLFCSACGELTIGLVGGHVQKVYGLDQNGILLLYVKSVIRELTVLR